MLSVKKKNNFPLFRTILLYCIKCMNAWPIFLNLNFCIYYIIIVFQLINLLISFLTLYVGQIKKKFTSFK